MHKEIISNYTKHQEFLKEFLRYRWFFTSTGKLVIGGKSAEQNDELLFKLKKSNEDFIVMHTASPGSPFSVILALKEEIKKTDIEEAAIFTGCFSREWRLARKKTTVDIFSLLQLYKSSTMKTGTWGVKGKIKRKIVLLKLVLAKQKNRLRAVPEKTIKNKKEIIAKIVPGNLDKKDLLSKLVLLTSSPLTQEEILSALPAGGVKIVK